MTSPAPESMMSDEAAAQWAEWGRGLAYALFWTAVDGEDASPGWALKMLLEGVCDVMACFLEDEAAVARVIKAQLIARRENLRFIEQHGRRPTVEEMGPALTRAHRAIVELQEAMAADPRGVIAGRTRKDGLGLTSDMETWATLSAWLLKGVAPANAHWIFASLSDRDGRPDPSTAQLTVSPTDAGRQLMLARMAASSLDDALKPLKETGGRA